MKSAKAGGASGAELANIVNEAALRAVRDGRKMVSQADLEESIEVVIAGYQKKNAILTDHENLDELSRFLYEKETITGEEFMEILNR